MQKRRLKKPYNSSNWKFIQKTPRNASNCQYFLLSFQSFVDNKDSNPMSRRALYDRIGIYVGSDDPKEEREKLEITNIGLPMSDVDIQDIIQELKCRIQNHKTVAIT